MIEVDNVLVSDEVLKEQFVCDLKKCKGGCCVEGDLGAPLLKEELPKVEGIIETVLPYLSDEAKEVLTSQGAYLLDSDGDFSTTTINNRECVFSFYEETGILKCSIEQAHKDKKTNFIKPISCHLYPIRVSQLQSGYEVLNYDKWEICSAACDLGRRLKVRVYEFLKQPLIRKYGEAWYKRLEQLVKDH